MAHELTWDIADVPSAADAAVVDAGLESCELQQLRVRDDHRRRGVGTRLLRSFEDGARRRGCKLLYLDTFSFQAPNFYRKHGFRVGCELKGFPDGVSKFITTRALDEG